jgi:hypothetical protein
MSKPRLAEWRLVGLGSLAEHVNRTSDASLGLLQISTSKAALGCLLIIFGTVLAHGTTSQDGYVLRDGNTWTLGTAKVERTIRLDGGRFVTTNWKNKASGHELIPSGSVSNELSAVVDGQEISGASGDWQLVGSQDQTLAQGEIQLEITVRQGSLEATKTYVVYPGSSIIREWVKLRNAGATPLKISEPRFLGLTASVGKPDSQDFYWMTGAENQPGSWELKKENLEPGKAREFDSYDPLGGTAEGNFVGDGVLARVLRISDHQIWPKGGWQGPSGNYIGTLWEYLPSSTVTIPLETTLDVAAGDKIAFILNKYGTPTSDRTAFDPTIAYADGETHTASKEFSPDQGKNGWWYESVEGGDARPGTSNFAGFWRANPQYVNLVYKCSTEQWRKPADNAAESAFISADEMHPGSGQGVARIWRAPKAGKIRITASLVNVGNPPVPGGGRHLRAGSSTYAPWNALMSREDGEGLFVGWDYIGHWASAFEQRPDGSVDVGFRVAGHHQSLAPGESLTAPMAFVGLFTQDLDNAGNECLDWQYRYLWDYTRDAWFPAIRISGWWWKGAAWFDLLNFGSESPSDFDSIYRKVFRVADLMSEVGADVYHRDWGWWDRIGDWNGPDFRTTGEYLKKHSMGQLIYAPIYVVNPDSKVAREHAPWVIDNTLDLSQLDVVEYLKKVLDGFADRYGAFEFKNDGWFTVQHDHDDTPLLREDEGYREVIRHFLDKHPDCAYMNCIGGGNGDGYDLKRYTSTGSFSDGPVGMLCNYWASLILPPDKTSENGDNWGMDKFDKATYRGLLTINFDIAADTWDPEKLEGMRELIDIYHYLLSQGVVGRWVHVFRPIIAGDDSTLYFERLSYDGRRGIIIPKRPAPGAVTIRPKGLNAEENYQVSFQESKAGETRTGADLMEKGIRLERMIPGELIYLNLLYHPGNRLDNVPPTAPGEAHKAEATNMGYPGIEVSWKAGHDDQWVSYYEVLRDGAVLDKVAKGTYYFDHSAGADLAAKYEVRTVDEAGLSSGLTLVEGPTGERALVIDDATDGRGLSYKGNWNRQRNQPPAYEGTITVSQEKGASFTVAFSGKRFTWFTKLDDHCGKAQVEVDGQPDAVVDTYSADDIWGVGIYTKEFPEGGAHTVKVTVLGERGGPPHYGQGIAVRLDGVRIER